MIHIIIACHNITAEEGCSINRNVHIKFLVSDNISSFSFFDCLFAFLFTCLFIYSFVCVFLFIMSLKLILMQRHPLSVG